MSPKPTAGSLSVRERGGADRSMMLHAIAFIINTFKLKIFLSDSQPFIVICINFHHTFFLFK